MYKTHFKKKKKITSEKTYHWYKNNQSSGQSGQVCLNCANYIQLYYIA